MMRVGVLFSGGKDSTYATYLASLRERVCCLITLFPKRQDSYMFHYPNIEWTKLQAEAMEIPQITAETQAVKEEELTDLESAIRMAIEKYDIEGVYTGALASIYQKSRVERTCDRLGLDCISPLWQINPELHLRNLLRDGFRVIITSVSALGLNESWLGREINEEVIKELVKLHAKYGIHVGLEGGEGETFVLDCPLFKRMIRVISCEKVWQSDSGYLKIKEAQLVDKHLRL